MKTNFDFSKEWEKTKQKLEVLSKEAVVLAKKGEEELVKFSKKGKLRLDSAAIGLKIEQLYYLIGKEYVKTKNSEKTSAALQSLVSQIIKLENEQRALKGRIKRSSSGSSVRRK